MRIPSDSIVSAMPDLTSRVGWEFFIDCERNIHTVARLLDLLAQRDLSIRSISMGSLGEDAALELWVDGLSVHQAAIITEKMSAVIGVTRATVTPR